MLSVASCVLATPSTAPRAVASEVTATVGTGWEALTSAQAALNKHTTTLFVKPLSLL
jgi:hypothetical protein